ncbi:MAG: hypothetical protein Gaeavirus9_2 [Gaeavirus sp.]|uniref:Uncharacterized protein n=1 Tax=Gaeavirus sp. TaxID=2487767 RepID=A0A3G4ZYY8_9VIRU|nr:MAG: hypothetical protein Gaeavirus9_2 [Gaeavirus sp.]
MDINEYINNNLSEVISDLGDIIKEERSTLTKTNWLDELETTSKIFDARNEDEATQEEYEQELSEELYYKRQEQQSKDTTDYMTTLLNVFMMYYNEKYEKTDNFFTGITEPKSDTSTQMELFYEYSTELNIIKDKLLKSGNTDYINYYYPEDDTENVTHMMELFTEQIYCLELDDIHIISPSLLICLTYLITKKQDKIYDVKDWKIYNLRDN